MSTENQVDIHKLIQEFNTWQKHSIELTREKSVLQDQLMASNKEVLELKKKEKTHQQEMSDMRNMVGNIQKSLHQSCDREEENKVLQKSVEAVKSEVSTLCEKHSEEISLLHRKMKDAGELHKIEMESMKEAMLMEAEELRQSHVQEMQKKTEEFEQLQEDFKKFEREKQSELCSLRMEYDAKFMKLQKQQASKVPQSNTMSTINQDIFRKKLQHTKAESEREINSLKRKVEELQHKLSTQDTRAGSTFQTPAPSSSKRRRF